MADKKEPLPSAPKATESGMDLVRELADLLDEKNLAEIELELDDWRVRLSRNVAPVHAVHAAHVPAPAPAAGSGGGGAGAAEPAADHLDHPGVVTSPMVGIVYTRPDPNSPDFVKVGDQVAQGDTLLLIEAMKVFNPITATKAGRVARFLVENGIPVEFGEPLLIIE